MNGVGNLRARRTPLSDVGWLLLFPALFLPNLGFARPTAFGTLDLCDFLIGPYLILLLIVRRPKQRQLVSDLVPLLAALAGWCVITVVTMFRYDYGPGTLMIIASSFLKIAKVVLYALAGVYTVKAISSANASQHFRWSLLGALLVTSLGLILTPQARSQGLEATGYKAVNAVSVALAVLLCYVGASWVEGSASRRWRWAALAVSVVSTAALLASTGRGGWLAAFCGLAYIVGRRGIDPKAIAFIAVSALATWYAYDNIPQFRADLDRTLSPDAQYMEMYNVGVLGVDDGSRIFTWINEAPKFLDSPLLGTGFFHRGGLSGLWSTGSHNFFLQMFLETGLPGGLLSLFIFARLWRHGGGDPGRRPIKDVPLRSALVAAIVGGLGGEYYYSGICIMALFGVYALVGSQPARPIARRSHNAPERPAFSAGRGLRETVWSR